MSYMLLFINLIGFGYASRKSLIKWIFYKFYILIILIFLLTKILFVTNNLLVTIDSKVTRIVNFINYYLTYIGNFVIFLEVFLSSKNFIKIFEMFSEVDEILSSKFKMIVDYQSLKRTNCMIVILAFSEICLIFSTRLQVLHFSDNLAVITTHCVIVSITVMFLTLTGNLIYRLILLHKIIKSNKLSVREINDLTEIFRKICGIVDEINRFFSLKFPYVSSEFRLKNVCDELI